MKMLEPYNVQVESTSVVTSFHKFALSSSENIEGESAQGQQRHLVKDGLSEIHAFSTADQGTADRVL